MASVLVRHGSNTHNDQGPIAVLPTNKAAKALLESGKVDCYNGQYLEIVALSSLDGADRTYVQQTLSLTTTLECCSRVVEEWELLELDGGYYEYTGKCYRCSVDV